MKFAFPSPPQKKGGGGLSLSLHIFISFQLIPIKFKLNVREFVMGDSFSFLFLPKRKQNEMFNYIHFLKPVFTIELPEKRYFTRLFGLQGTQKNVKCYLQSLTVW